MTIDQKAKEFYPPQPTDIGEGKIIDPAKLFRNKFIEGAKWMQSEYGCTPEQVKSMREGLKAISYNTLIAINRVQTNKQVDVIKILESIIFQAENALNSAHKEK